MTSGWLQGDFRVTSGWLQDDFRITSGWLQDDFRTDFSTGYCLLTLTSHLLIWSYFSQFNALNTTFIYHLCDLTFFHQLEILAIIGSTLMMVQYPKSADCNNTTTLHTLPILLSMSDWLSNWQVGITKIKAVIFATGQICFIKDSSPAITLII